MHEEIFNDANAVASKAAEYTVNTLANALKEKGTASWVLAGGSSPMAAYKIIANAYADAVDWSRVTVLIGDERCVPIDHDDSNWGQISKILFTAKPIADSIQLIPQAYLGADVGAANYSQQIRKALMSENEEISYDILWLGVGEDGHTLSLFPNHAGIMNNSDLVIPVHDSPKPPSDRITLSLENAVRAKEVVIFAVGASKREAIIQLEEDPRSLPIGLFAGGAVSNGAKVLWLYDAAAKS